ncbi:MAG: hypothetical protein KGL39_44595 [Patescibacteria group bacterium]|nr:hypothetical protein [Patescibacteria group bacterium]
MKRRKHKAGVLAGELDVAALVDALDFHDEDVERAARAQPRLFLEASRYRVQKMRARVMLDTRLETVRAEAALHLRDKRRNSTGRALTEAAVRNYVDTHRKCGRVARKAQKAQVEEEFSKLLVEAFRQRAQALKIIVEAYGAEMAKEIRVYKEEQEREGMARLRHNAMARLRGLPRDKSDSKGDD